MTELRWLVRGDGHDDSPTERVLQFRIPISAGLEWSEWEDVPEAREEARDK